MHLQQCLDHFPQGEGLESYSFLTLDPNWDMIQRGGIWASRELEVAACLHSDFIQSPSLCEVVVRWVLNSYIASYMKYTTTTSASSSSSITLILYSWVDEEHSVSSFFPYLSFLGMFTKLWRVTKWLLGLIMSVCPSLHLCGTT